MNLKKFFQHIFYAYLVIYSIPLFLSVFKHFLVVIMFKWF